MDRAYRAGPDRGFPFVRRDFVYLVQDFEPGFYPWGPEYAAAEASYALDHTPVFNSTPLRAYFHRLGLARGDAPAFHPSIDLARYMTVPRAPNPVPRLAIYGRPRVARNLFDTCIGALDRFIAAKGIAAEDIDLVSVGLAHPDVILSGGHRVRSLGKIPWDQYATFLGTVDVGLSLMLSPHPSHLPLEMAAAGARVVTNGFDTKDLGTLSPAITSVRPTVPDVAAALGAVWGLGPTTLAERRIDIEALGVPLARVIDKLAVEMGQGCAPLAEAG